MEKPIRTGAPAGSATLIGGGGRLVLIVAAENLPFITPGAGEIWLRNALEPLVADAALRRQVGEANRAKAKPEAKGSRKRA